MDILKKEEEITQLKSERDEIKAQLKKETDEKIKSNLKKTITSMSKIINLENAKLNYEKRKISNAEVDNKKKLIVKNVIDSLDEFFDENEDTDEVKDTSNETTEDIIDDNDIVVTDVKDNTLEPITEIKYFCNDEELEVMKKLEINIPTADLDILFKYFLISRNILINYFTIQNQQRFKKIYKHFDVHTIKLELLKISKLK